MGPEIANILTIDVEEYFHPTEVQSSVRQSQWDSLPSRVDREIDDILEILHDKRVQATFFVLGWVAERRPKLLRAIASAGHEIGCHSYSHQLVYGLSPDAFRQDTLRAIAAIEDASGIRTRAYRAPSYSITRQSMWALEVLVECGFTHDSSIYPIAHDRYGIDGFERHGHMIETPAGPIFETPIATVVMNGSVTPIGGGAYLRLLPYRYTAAGIRRLNRVEQKPACIYFHPWEIDPDQPRLASGLISSWRTYSGLNRMKHKLERLLSDFRFAPLSAAYPSLAARAGA